MDSFPSSKNETSLFQMQMAASHQQNLVDLLRGYVGTMVDDNDLGEMIINPANSNLSLQKAAALIQGSRKRWLTWLIMKCGSFDGRDKMGIGLKTKLHVKAAKEMEQDGTILVPRRERGRFSESLLYSNHSPL
jgi:hypothetical protein